MMLATARLALAPYRIDDVDALHRLWTMPEVRRYLFDDVSIERRTAAEIVARDVACWTERGLGQFALRPPGQSQIIGFAGLLPIANTSAWELIYGLDPAHWRRGLAVEAGRVVLELAFANPGIDRVYARTDPPNAASLRVAQRLGMRTTAGLPDNPGLLTYVIDRDAAKSDQ